MIVTPLDSAELDSKDHYVFYHNMVKHAFKALIKSSENQQLYTAQELIFFKQYCELFLYSVEAMRIKYMYDDESNMKVDLTDSGFPNYLEFRYLYNDLALREEYKNKLTDIDALKADFLDTLLRKKESISQRKLFQAASIVYYTSVEQQYIFNRFVQGKIIPSEAKSAAYMTSWSFYDVAYNRPFVCFMYFDYKGKKIEDYKSKLYSTLKETADRKMNLDTMAYSIDRKLPDIFPKHIKRIDIGPLHNIFAKDENSITHAILESIAQKNIPLESFAFALQIDEVFSGSEFKEGNFFSKQTLQKWSAIVKQRYVFAPHRVIQMLYNKTPELMSKLTKPPFQIEGLNPLKK